MTQDEKKRLVAGEALKYVEPDALVGVGTGSTVNFFIEALAAMRTRIRGAVASSTATAERLQRVGIPVVELNNVGPLSIYVDGADEATRFLHMVKGGGGALAREKILAAASKKFVCIIDDSKLVNVLGNFPLPIEVISMARSFVARELVKLGGQPNLRAGFMTDNGNAILDVRNLRITEPAELECKLNNIPGVVCNGVFANRPADVLLVGGDTSVQAFV